MGWVDDLHGQLVALDTAPLIYYIEEHPTYLPLVGPFFDALADGALSVVTSTITLIEVLTQPLRQGDAQLEARYRELLLPAEGLTVLAVSNDIAETAASLRAKHGLRTPDGIQLSTGITAHAAAFLTNDLRLSAIHELRVVVLDQLANTNA